MAEMFKEASNIIIHDGKFTAITVTAAAQKGIPFP